MFAAHYEQAGKSDSSDVAGSGDDSMAVLASMFPPPQAFRRLGANTAVALIPARKAAGTLRGELQSQHWLFVFCAPRNQEICLIQCEARTALAVLRQAQNDASAFAFRALRSDRTAVQLCDVLYD